MTHFHRAYILGVFTDISTTVSAKKISEIFSNACQMLGALFACMEKEFLAQSLKIFCFLKKLDSKCLLAAAFITSKKTRQSSQVIWHVIKLLFPVSLICNSSLF